MTKFVYAFTLLFFVMGNTFVHALENECGSYAEIDGTSYVLSPSGGDDTATIQCALDSAISQGMPTVRLDRGTFYTNELRTTGFNGSFTGTTRKDSKLLINDGIADCSAETVPIIAFLGGNVAVRSMTIDTYTPCSGAGRFIVLYFSQESCAKRTLFATIDRVDLVHTGPVVAKGIQVSGALECLEQNKGPLGTLKLNRSTLTAFDIALQTSLYGAGQVDINFNDFINVDIGVFIPDASQSTTITGNTFDYNTGGVLAGTVTDFSASKNRTVVHNNTFVNQDTGAQSEAIIILNEFRRASHSVVVTDNVINLQRNGSLGFNQRGVTVLDMDGALISGNTFRGSAWRAIQLGSTAFASESVDNAILGNTFSLTTTDVDIYIGVGSRNAVIGSQGATYTNLGINTLIGR